MPVTMLHGPFGIGVLGEEAMEFIDFLSDAGFQAWQVLPIEHTTIFSPYNCISAFAGEPMLIDPRMLLNMGLITADELSERADGTFDDFVDHKIVREKQRQLLRTAYSKLRGRPYAGFKPPWLETYALFMALMHHFDNEPWYKWPDEGLRAHDAVALKKAKTEFADEIDFYKFVQWIFSEQWRKMKEYAAKRGISIIGDMPFYVAENSAEVWSRRKLFNADPDGSFKAVSGAPPDYFSPKGQHWGNPIYNWSAMKKSGYKWWIHRVSAAFKRYDHVRIDHFRGFDSYWSIPPDAEDARGGKWVEGPGIAPFKAMEAAFGSTDLPLIAEDLGDTHGNVEKLLKDTGYRGMRVLQFGFMGDDKHLPHNITEDYVAYTGTHDNTTMLAWLFELAPEDRERALMYIGFEGDWTAGGPNSPITRAWIRTLFATGASLAVVPIQDMLGYGADTRMNTPGTVEGNWRFRIRKTELVKIDTKYYNALHKATERVKSEELGVRS